MESSTPARAETGSRFGRRRLVKGVLGFVVVSTAALVGLPIVGFLVPPKSTSGASGTKQLAGTTEDIPVGKGKVVPFGSKPVVVVNTEQGVKAYSAICTHLGCIVAWDETLKHIVCPCHDGHFNPSSGSVLSGPPPAPLPPVEVSVEGKDIYLVSS